MKEVLFTKDIIKQVSDESGFTVQQIEYVYKYMMDYLHHLIRYTDAVSIIIPHLGCLYIKAYTPYRVMEKTKSKRIIEAAKLKIIKLHEFYASIFNDPNKKRKNKCRHTERARMSTYFYTDGLRIKEIEKIQNETKK